MTNCLQVTQPALPTPGLYIIMQYTATPLTVNGRPIILYTVMTDRFRTQLENAIAPTAGN
jgi:hypothetical protein